MTSSTRTVTLVCSVLAVIVFGATACGSSSGGGGGGPSSGGQSDHAGKSGAPQRGGSLTVLEEAAFSGGWPAGLDPATNPNGSGNLTQYQAIFGGLFLLRSDKDGANAKIEPNQAASGTLSKDAKTLTIKLRPGITFTDGTPMNAKAVLWNFQRANESSCSCKPSWTLRKTDPFTSPDPLTVVIHLAQPNAALLHSFPSSNVNWIVSPTAAKKMTAKAFALKPVGAGPFVVVSDKLSSTLVLERNPNYFKKNLPYLDKLTFQSIGGAQAAYQAMVAGQGDAYEGMSEPPIIKQAQDSSKLQVTMQPQTAVWDTQFNTLIPPLNNKKAREALYYATNWQAINKGVFAGKLKIFQSFTTPTGLFYHQKVPGYRTYDLDKAKALVKQLGGLHVKLSTIDGYTAREVMTAVQTQWEKAGVEVDIEAYQLNRLLKLFNSGKWQIYLGAVGAWDPAAGLGIRFTYSSNSPRSGVKDPHLDQLFSKVLSTTDSAVRDQVYQQISKYMSDQAYGMFGFAPGRASVAVNGVHGPGLTTKIPALRVNTGIIWSEAWTENH